MTNNIWKWHYSYFKSKIVFTVILIDFNFPETAMRSVECRLQHYVQLLQVFEIVSIKWVRIATLIFQGHATSSDSWPFELPQAIPYRCSMVYWHSISKEYRDIEADVYLCHCLDLSRWVTDVIDHDHSFRAVWFPIGVTFTPTRYFCKILSLKYIWVATLTFKVTWRHQSRDHSIGHWQPPLGVPLVLTLDLQGISS